uniref:TIR domain-containing protein n=1 Tax=Biomphalaria glabrata TaxID=6526 RepID=A0A2C9M457_BIOGL
MATNDIEPDAVPFTEASPNFPHYREYRHLFNYDLRKDNFEILIINHDDDEPQVRQFKSLLEKNVRYQKYNELAYPKVELLRDVQFEDETPTPELDFALSKTLLIFLFATESFVEDKWTVLQGRASLEAAIKKNNSFQFIVYQGKPKNITLPAILASLKLLNFYDKESDNEGLHSNVRKVLESNVSVLLDKDKKLSLRRRQFLKDEYPHLLEDLKPSTGVSRANYHQDLESKPLHCQVHASRQILVTNSNVESKTSKDVEVDSSREGTHDPDDLDFTVLNFSPPSERGGRFPPVFANTNQVILAGPCAAVPAKLLAADATLEEQS